MKIKSSPYTVPLLILTAIIITNMMTLSLLISAMAVKAESISADYVSSYHGRVYTDHNLVAWHTAPVNQSRCWLNLYTTRYNDSADFRGDNCWIETGESYNEDKPDNSGSDNPVITDNTLPESPAELPETINNDSSVDDTKVKNNNGHGNNVDGVDCSNPGKSKTGKDSDSSVDDEKGKGNK